MAQIKDHLDQSILDEVRKDVVTLRQDFTVQEALEAIRQRDVGKGEIYYFYVVDHEDRLTGVIPARRLLAAQPEQPILDIMVKRVVAIPHTATVMETCEYFVMHKFLAFPVVDEKKRFLGIVDVNLFTEEAFDIAERERVDEIFEAIGFRASQVFAASPARAFRFRFPWLLTTIASGTVCAFLVGGFQITLEKSLVLAFFLTLVLGLGESVSIQSMTVAIQALRSVKPTFDWYLGALRRELGTAVLLGAACGAVVGQIVWIWRGVFWESVAIGASILLSLSAACLLGLSVPAFLHAVKLDLKIAAGPVTLALTDIFTLLFYFTLAVMIL
jgi:magnesium transporter